MTYDDLVEMWESIDNTITMDSIARSFCDTHDAAAVREMVRGLERHMPKEETQ